MMRSASGSIQVVTNVARLRVGMPSSTISFSIRPIASSAVMPDLRQLVVGGGLEQVAVAVTLLEALDLLARELGRMSVGVGSTLLMGRHVAIVPPTQGGRRSAVAKNETQSSDRLPRWL